jgi:hypothetical protein
MEQLIKEIKKLTYILNGIRENYYQEQLYVDYLSEVTSVSGEESENDGEILPLPYPGCSGKWVLRNDFNGNKSFSFFKCSNCNKRWMSSKGFKKYKQACKKCKVYVFPEYMWQNIYINIYKNNRKNKKTLNDNNKPHMKKFCEACKKGVCEIY